MKICASLLTCFTGLLLSSCYYDVESELYPPSTATTCDTVNVTYSGQVQPVIESNCYTCHSNAAAAAAGGNVMLEGYANLQRVASEGRLYRAISHTGPSPMPKGGNKLPDCDIRVIKKWIDNGIPNN